MVPAAGSKVWLLAENEVPFHLLPVVVFTTAAAELVMVVPAALADAVPVMVPAQLAP